MLIVPKAKEGEIYKNCFEKTDQTTKVLLVEKAELQKGEPCLMQIALTSQT